MRTKRLLPFVLCSGLVHVALLTLAPSTARMAADATGSLRVTLLAPDRPRAAPRPTPPAGAKAIARTDMRHASFASPAMPPVRQDPVTAVVDTPRMSASTAHDRQARAEVRGRRLRLHLDRALEISFIYPLIAQRQGWQGEVRIALTVRADGVLTNIRVSRSSGYAILDDAAMESVRRIRAIPEAVAVLDGENVDFVLPVRYELRSS